MYLGSGSRLSTSCDSLLFVVLLVRFARYAAVRGSVQQLVNLRKERNSMILLNYSLHRLIANKTTIRCCQPCVTKYETI